MAKKLLKQPKKEKAPWSVKVTGDDKSAVLEISALKEVEDYVYINGTGYDFKKVIRHTPIWGAAVTPTSSCCGFFELTGFANEDDYAYDFAEDDGRGVVDKKWWETHHKDIVKELKKKLEESRITFLQAYVPENGEYSMARYIFKELGFKPTISLPSNPGHGKYHNVRWEYISPKAKPVKVKEVTFEKNIRALDV